MSKAPSMPMYWDAYLADTTHLDTTEHGAYLLLLAAMWRRNGTVPDDDRDNARIVGLSAVKWRKVKARFCETINGFEVENGEISQRKLRKTWHETQEKIEINRANGAKGGRPKSNKNKDIAKANGFISGNPIKTIPEPEPEPDIEKREAKASPKKKASRLSEDWVLPMDWGEWAVSQGWAETTVRTEAEKFRDFWVSKPGKDGTKLDWKATWRNWMRNSKTPKVIHGDEYGKPSDGSERLQRIVTAAAAGSSQKDWG